MGKDYLRQILSGRVDLKVKHLVAILGAVGLPPRDFFADFYGRRTPPPFHHPFGGRLVYLEGPPAGAGPPNPAVAFLARRLRERGILTDEEAAGLVMEF